MCCDGKFFWIKYSIFFWEERFPHCYLGKQFFWIAYFTEILSFKKFFKDLHWNLKHIFLFSVLFVHFEIGYRQSYITLNFFFWYMNLTLYIHSDVFYPASLTLKMLYADFFWAWFVTICLLSFLFINVFLTNSLTFYDFPLLLYAMFFLSTNITKIDMINAKVGKIVRLELKVFFATQLWWVESC